MDKKKGLGRGLESLFAMYDNTEPMQESIENKEQTKVVERTVESPKPQQTVTPTVTTEKRSNSDGITELDIYKIQPNPNQPRKHFDEEALQELASSIKLHGVIQPLVVNKTDDNTYLIIAGERRWRASKIAGIEKVPVVIKNYTEKQIREISIIENLQREDLNPIEEAVAYTGIGRAKLYEMTNREDCPFVLWIGNRRVIKRQVFDEYIANMYSV